MQDLKLEVQIVHLPKQQKHLHGSLKREDQKLFHEKIDQEWQCTLVKKNAGHIRN